MNKHDICRYIYDNHDITIGSELSQSMIFGFMIRDDVSLIDGTTAGLDFGRATARKSKRGGCVDAREV